MKPSYMGPNSPVKTEFKEFCASEAMDSEPRLLFRAFLQSQYSHDTYSCLAWSSDRASYLVCNHT